MMESHRTWRPYKPSSAGSWQEQVCADCRIYSDRKKKKKAVFQHRCNSSSMVSSACTRWPGKGCDSFWGHQGWGKLLKNGQAHICEHSCSKRQDPQETLALMNCWVSRAGSRKRTKNINLHQLVAVHHETDFSKYPKISWFARGP